MKRSTLDLLACPACRGALTAPSDSAPVIDSGALHCPRCQKDYPIKQSIPQFIRLEDLTGFNRRFARMYDWFSWGYRLFMKAAFAFIGMDEEAARREITDRLEPNGGRVLEVSIGPGVNLPYFLMKRPDVGEVFGLDISLGRLALCRRFVRRQGWEVDLFLGNGEQLPFKDESFESIFHIGGVSFFKDKQAAIGEMIRVAKPGARILIADETEKGARGYEKIIPGFTQSFDGKREPIRPPLDLAPPEMLETRIFDAWKGWFYCIEFRLAGRDS